MIAKKVLPVNKFNVQKELTWWRGEYGPTILNHQNANFVHCSTIENKRLCFQHNIANNKYEKCLYLKGDYSCLILNDNSHIIDREHNGELHY